MSGTEHETDHIVRRIAREPDGTPDPHSEAAANLIIDACGPELWNPLTAMKFYRSFRPGQEIMAAGEETEFVGFVMNGVVRLSKSLADGRHQTVGLCFPTQFIGRPLRPIATYDAAALTPVRLCLFSRRRFDALLQSSQPLEERVLEIMLDKLDEAHDWLLVLGRKNALEKVATFLVLMARREAALRGSVPRDGLIFNVSLTREAIADYLALTTESVSRHFSHLRGDGVIQLVDARNVCVPSFHALLNTAGENDDGKK